MSDDEVRAAAERLTEIRRANRDGAVLTGETFRNHIKFLLDEVDRLRDARAVLEAGQEVAWLKEGIRLYMADDPQHATDCAITDPYPAHGPCDCEVDEFVRAALSTPDEPT